jgi:hypothetical protein
MIGLIKKAIAEHKRQAKKSRPQWTDYHIRQTQRYQRMESDMNELVRRLELIPPDLIVCVHEGEFLAIGAVCADALRYIKLLEEECSTSSRS